MYVWLSDWYRDVRTVTVWLQNRRQLAKKENSVPPPSPVATLNPKDREPRKALANVGRHDTNGRYRAPADRVAMEKQLDRRPATPKADAPYPFTGLQIAAAVFEDPAKLLPFKRNSAIRERIYNEERTSSSDQAQKRQRTRFSYSSLESGDTTDDDMDDLVDVGSMEDLHPPATKAISGGCPLMKSASAEISREFAALFPPDLLFGASLLLAFKHSST